MIAHSVQEASHRLTSANIVKYDLGDVIPIGIVFVTRSTNSNMYCRLSVSTDDVTYTLVVNHNSTSRATYAILTTARYILVHAHNSDSSLTNACEFNTLEAYNASNAGPILDYIVTSTITDMITIMGRGYSNVLEVVQL